MVVTFTLMTVSFPAFAKDKKVKPAQNADVSTLSEADQIRYNYFYLEAIRQQNASHYSAAFDLLNHAIGINPKAAEAYFAQSSYFSELKQDSLALLYMLKAARLNPDNSTYLERVAQFYINDKLYDRAIDAYEEIYSRNHDRSDVLSILGQLYQQQKDYLKMISVIDRIELSDGSSEDLTLSKMRVYEMMNDKKSAFKTLKSLSNKHPNDLNYKVMIGNWLMQNNKQKEAYEIYADAQKEEPDNALVQSSLYDYYKTVGDSLQANMLMEQILTSPKTESQSKISMLQQAIRNNESNGGDSLKMIDLFKRVMAANPNDGDIAELNAAYMSLKKLPQDSINNALKHVLAISPDNAGARLQLIQAEWPKKNWDEIIALSKPAQQYNPDEMAFYYFMGLAYYQKDNHDKALDTFRRGVGEINSQSNPDIVSDFYAMMGDILHQKGQTKEAFAAYDSCLQWKADNVECLNNYAYYLSEENRELQRAEQMSYKTIKAEPKNSTFLDTYAWILFMQERYSEAKIYIDQAVANDTDSVQNAVVIEHAGDIHAMNNDIPLAMEYWQKALKMGGEKAMLTKKIKLKKYIKASSPTNH
jgi:tetratricopeptide (TPR) repeat protein